MRCRQMNRHDAEKTVTEYLKPIFGFALKRCRSVHDAEDMSQEIIMNIFRALLVKDDIADIEKFSEEYLQKEINEDGSFLNESQQNKIKEAESYPAQYWFALADWAKSNNAMTPIDRHSAYNFGTLRSQNKPFKSLKQALTALRIAKMAKEQGFNA